MLWLIIAILAYFLFAFVSLGDKYLLKGAPEPKTYTFYVGLFSIVVLILIPFVDGSYDAWIFPTAAEADADDTTNAENSKIYTKLVETGSSHLDKSNLGEPETILEWIKQGAKDN